MTIAAIDRLIGPPSYDALPLRIEQSASGLATLGLCLIAIPVAVAVLLPLAVLAAAASQEPAVLWSLVQRPALMLQLAFGLVLLGLIAGYPAHQIAKRLGRVRTISISEGRVAVTDRGILASWSWSAPVTEFAGVAAHIRASVSGSRHELILVHPDRRRSLLLQLSDRAADLDAASLAHLLGLPELSPRAIYAAPATAALRPAPAGIGLQAAAT